MTGEFTAQSMPLAARMAALGLSLGALAGISSCSGLELEEERQVELAPPGSCAPMVPGQTVDSLDDLPGDYMRQDFNDHPLFRAGTVHIAGANAYGSGGLHRRTDGSYVVRSADHVLDEVVRSPEGGIFFPGVGWLALSGCSLHEASDRQIGDSVAEFPNTAGPTIVDTIVEVKIPLDFVDNIQAAIDAGAVEPLKGVASDDSRNNPDIISAEGGLAVLPRADTGRWTVLGIDDQLFTPGAPVLNLVPSSKGGGNICQGRSGQPVLIADAAGNLKSLSWGVTAVITSSGSDYEGLRDGACSDIVGIVTYTGKA